MKRDHKHYFPILKGKQGELRAIRYLDTEARAALTPILEIPAIEWDFEDDSPKKTIDEQISSFADNIGKNWGTDLCFVDGYPVAEAGPTASGDHAMTVVFQDARNLGLRAVPVTGLDRDPAYTSAVRDIVSLDGRGVCVRLTSSQIGTAGDGLLGQINGLLATLGTTPQTTDLLVDMGAMDTSLEHAYGLAVPVYVNSLPHLADWRNVIVSGTSFPSPLPVPTASTGRPRRTEWHVWSGLTSGGRFTRKPSYSDYGADSPEYVSLDFRIIKMAANVRYTHTDYWVVVRGTVILKGKPSQYPGLAAILRALPEYMGRNFSTGDAYIDDTASGTGNGGSATTWRQVATNHHLTFVVRQIASHPAL